MLGSVFCRGGGDCSFFHCLLVVGSGQCVQLEILRCSMKTNEVTRAMPSKARRLEGWGIIEFLALC